MSNDYDGRDKRHVPYSNIEQKLYEKPIFSIGALLVMAGLLIRVVLYVVDIDHRAMDLGKENKAEIKHVREMQKIQKERFDDSIKDVKEQYEKIDEKLDKLINRELDR